MTKAACIKLADTIAILPHPEVRTYVERKARNPDRWLEGMRRLRRRSLDLLAEGWRSLRIEAPRTRQRHRR